MYTLYWGFKKIPFNLYTYVLPKVIQNGAKFRQKLTPGFKSHMGNWNNLRKAVESPKSRSLMGYFCPKNTFLQLKHYIQRIYLTLPSITCAKVHQIFHIKTPLYFFSSNFTYFLQRQSIKVQIFRLPTARYNVHQIPHVIY